MTIPGQSSPHTTSSAASGHRAPTTSAASSPSSPASHFALPLARHPRVRLLPEVEEAAGLAGRPRRERRAALWLQLCAVVWFEQQLAHALHKKGRQLQDVNCYLGPDTLKVRQQAWLGQRPAWLDDGSCLPASDRLVPACSPGCRVCG